MTANIEAFQSWPARWLFCTWESWSPALMLEPGGISRNVFPFWFLFSSLHQGINLLWTCESNTRHMLIKPALICSVSSVLSLSPIVCLLQNRDLFGGKFVFSFSAINMSWELCNTGVSVCRTLDLVPLPFEPGKLCFRAMFCLEFEKFNRKHRQTELQSTAWLKTHRLLPTSERLL